VVTIAPPDDETAIRHIDFRPIAVNGCDPDHRGTGFSPRMSHQKQLVTDQKRPAGQKRCAASPKVTPHAALSES
jgi:hypothetical protein